MLVTELFDKNVKDYEAWFERYPEVYESELAAIREHMAQLPENIRGIEVGVGTGRFAQPLGIKEGIEPSEEMAKKAAEKNIEIVKGFAEQLPYADLQFDFVLFVTVCHLENVKLAIKQAQRVLKPKGSIIVGFLDKDMPIAKKYSEERQYSTFFRKAKFYSVHYIKQLMKETGFKNLEIRQTLFGELDSIKDIQSPKPGYGEGSFVVVRATKK